MSNEPLYDLFATVPRDSDRAILVYPSGGKTAITCFGMTAEQVAETLYSMADEIVDQRIPPPDWRERIK